ncbi:ABC transporter permease [Sciscionella sediminilitoris]|uniref:ABC transporter permease n=1 Tax=Sciscionella sediminilitoris TaxID=1445613 RepID=UPI00068AE2DE|nr:ABC transporter permease [Sciscionella sp. SE31]
MSTLQDDRKTTNFDIPVSAPPPRASVYRLAVGSELMKIRGLRSTHAFLAAGVLVMAVGALIIFILVQSYDASSPAKKAGFEASDPTVVSMPFVMFFIGAIGAMIITTEFTTKSIGPTLIAVPQRRTLMGAKATVAALVGLVCGLVFSVLSFVDSRLLFGDRPAPFNPWPRWADGIPTVFGAALMVLVSCLVALGLGAMMRSTAAALTTLGALVLVVPIFAHFLPAPWDLRLASILLPNLTSQLGGGNHPYVFSPGGALVVAASYVVLALGGGAISVMRRDIS